MRSLKRHKTPVLRLTGSVNVDLIVSVNSASESHLSFCLALFGSVCMLNCVMFLRSLSLRRFLWRYRRHHHVRPTNTGGLNREGTTQGRLSRAFLVVPGRTSCGSSGRPSSASWPCPPAGSSSHPPRGSRRTGCRLQTERNICLTTEQPEKCESWLSDAERR